MIDVRAGETLNGRGLQDRGAVNMTMSSSHARLMESGRFCCSATYNNLNGEAQSVSRCEEMKGKSIARCHI